PRSTTGAVQPAPERAGAHAHAVSCGARPDKEARSRSAAGPGRDTGAGAKRGPKADRREPPRPTASEWSRTGQKASVQSPTRGRNIGERFRARALFPLVSADVVQVGGSRVAVLVHVEGRTEGSSFVDCERTTSEMPVGAQQRVGREIGRHRRV